MEGSRKPTGFVEGELGPLLDEKLNPIKEKLDRRERERFALLALCGLCLVIAAASLYFAVSRGLALDDQIERNRQIVCSQVRSTAVGYRVQLPQEDRRSYVERLLAQRATLLAVGSLDCASVPGFETFPYLRGRALDEIEDILGQIAPKRLKEARKREAGLTDDSLLPNASGSVPSSTTALVPPAPGPVPAPLPGGGADTSPDQPAGDDGGGAGGGGKDPPAGGGGGGPPDESPGAEPPSSGGGGGGSSPAPEPEPEPGPTSSKAPTPEEAVLGVACGVQKGVGLTVTPALCPSQ